MGNVPGSDISLEVQRGEVVAITGRNGSGKTSLAKYLTGVVKPEKIGQILIDNLDPYSSSTGTSWPSFLFMSARIHVKVMSSKTLQRTFVSACRTWGCLPVKSKRESRLIREDSI